MIYVGPKPRSNHGPDRHAASMAKRVTQSQGFWEPLPVTTPHDELGNWRNLSMICFRRRGLCRAPVAAVRHRRFPTSAHPYRGSTWRNGACCFPSHARREEYQKHSPFFDDELKKLTRMVEGTFYRFPSPMPGNCHVETEPLYINEVLEEALRAGLFTREKKGNCHPAANWTKSFLTPATRRFYSAVSNLSGQCDQILPRQKARFT